jgi:hypothetical protein
MWGPGEMWGPICWLAVVAVVSDAYMRNEKRGAGVAPLNHGAAERLFLSRIRKWRELHRLFEAESEG